MPVKALLFDAIGTLLYAYPDVTTVYAEAGARFGCPLPREEIQSRFRQAYRAAFASEHGRVQPAAHADDLRRWRQVVTNVFCELDQTEALFDELWSHFATANSWQLFPDAPPAWHEALRRGMRVGVASNYDNRLLEVVKGHRLLADCELMFHSAALGYAKPDPRFFQAIAARLELDPVEILLVGDDWENDYLGARAAGWQAIYLNRSAEATQAGGIRSLAELCPVSSGERWPSGH